MESEKNPEEMTDLYLRDIILNFMIAGKDTSANTLSWFFYMLCKNPLVQEKVAQEVRDVIGGKAEDNKANIDDLVAATTDATLDQMHYLHAAMTETLRLFPAVPVVNSFGQFLDVTFSYLIASFHIASIILKTSRKERNLRSKTTLLSRKKVL